MDIKEAKRALSCFEEDHHIVVKYDNLNRDVELEVVAITFDGRNCVFVAEEEMRK